MDDVCYEVVAEALRGGYQVMVFVHSRKGTGTTAKALAERAATEGELEQLFIRKESLNEARTKYIARAEKSQNKKLQKKGPIGPRTKKKDSNTKPQPHPNLNRPEH